jgi:LCP family protein required for cell wall assembly
LVIAAAVYVVFFIKKTENQLEQMTETAKINSATVRVVSNMNVYARKTDGYTDLDQLKGKTIGVLDMMDTENVDSALAQLTEEFGEEPVAERYVGIMPLINSLKDGTTDAIIINAGYDTAITDNDESFRDWAELLCTMDITEETTEDDETADATGDTSGSAGSSVKKASVKPVTSVKPVENMTEEPVIIYLTGMDTRGDEIVAEVGNSDVNMVIAVNPNTKKILMINIPRDYYYYLWGDTNYPDKITHCGYYGVDCSIQTMNSLFDTNINYYVKVGFNSVVNIVNAIGGITVDSDYGFELDGYTITEGVNNLDGLGALQFSRERMSLPGGDRARGMNQQKVITAIIDKITSPEMIGNFSEILGAITSNVVTNISVDDMESIVKMQLNDNAQWDIESIQVDGSGAWDYCYSLGDANDVMVPDWSTVDAAKEKLNKVLAGE